jgi:hypothetical protein
VTSLAAQKPGRRAGFLSKTEIGHVALAQRRCARGVVCRCG